MGAFLLFKLFTIISLVLFQLNLVVVGFPNGDEGNIFHSVSVRNRGREECNCTSLFQCDLSSKESSEVSHESQADRVFSAHNTDDEDDEDGADLEVIDIRNGLSSSNSNFACKHYLEICCNVSVNGNGIYALFSIYLTE